VRAIAIVTAALTLAAAAARADDSRATTVAADERSEINAAHAGVAAGAALMILPAAVGGALEAGSDDIDVKRGGIYLLTGGMALAPIVSHLIAREWYRAVLFGALPVAAFASVVTLLQLHPDIFDAGSVATRVTYGTMICVSAIFSTVGVADSFGAARRVRARHRSLTIVPAVAPRGATLGLGGAF
jgi:hypothetical protein